jgi:glutamine amidotransferase
MKQVTIIDYGSGNLHSIAKAFERQAGASGFVVKVSNSAKDIENASHIVLPGVGAFADCLSGLKSAPGVLDALEKSVISDKKPFLGVCVGMQMLAESSIEQGMHGGLGWIKGKVVPINSQRNALKIPHMGWNELRIINPHPILSGIKTGDHAYFVHSYWMSCEEKSDIIASVEYGTSLTAIIANNNIIATQFHPEKSQQVGLKLINNFLNM